MSIDNMLDNEYFKNNEECKYYMKCKLTEYICNYVTDEVATLEDILEVNKLVQRQKTERLFKVYKEFHGIDRYGYGEQSRFYIYTEPYNDDILKEPADEQNGRNIPNMLSQLGFDGKAYE